MHEWMGGCVREWINGCVCVQVDEYRNGRIRGWMVRLTDGYVCGQMGEQSVSMWIDGRMDKWM